MNKKIATLVSVLALTSFGAHAQARGKANAGAASGQVNTALPSGQVNTALPSGQVNANGQVNGEANGQGFNAQVNGTGVNGQVNGVGVNGQADGAGVNGQVNGTVVNGQVNGVGLNGQVNGVGVPVNGQGVNAQGSVNAQGNATGQGNFAPPPAAPGDRPQTSPFSPAEQRANPRQFAIATNQPAGANTNQFAREPNQFGASTNQNGLSPTSRDPRLQRTYATNSPAGTNSSAAGSQDQAGTPFDRGMVTILRQRLQSQNTAPATVANVQFISNGGDVTVMGSVPTAADKSRIVSIVQSSPGVVRVTDQLTVAGSVAGVSATSQSAAPNNAAPVPNP